MKARSNSTLQISKLLKTPAYSLSQKHSKSSTKVKNSPSQVSLSEFYIDKALQSELHLGSSLPKSASNFHYINKVVKPHTEIVGDSILKAAYQIDQQTANIHWGEIRTVLRKSMTNMSRIKEIHHPIKNTVEKQEKNTKEPSSFYDFLDSNLESFKEEVKSIFEDGREKNKPVEEMLSNEKSRKRENSLLDYIKRSKVIGKMKIENDINRSICVSKYKMTRKKLNMKRATHSEIEFSKVEDTKNVSLAISPSSTPKMYVKITRKHRVSDCESHQADCKMCNTLPETPQNAPYSVQMKGRKMKSNFGAMFVPAFNSTLTPNHFLNFSDI
jgi:hypothetical protein